MKRKRPQDPSFFKQTLKSDPSFFPVSPPLCHIRANYPKVKPLEDLDSL